MKPGTRKIALLGLILAIGALGAIGLALADNINPDGADMRWSRADHWSGAQIPNPGNSLASVVGPWHAGARLENADGARVSLPVVIPFAAGDTAASGWRGYE